MTTSPASMGEPLSEAELAAIQDLWTYIRAEHVERTSFGAEMVPVNVGLFDIKIAKVFAELESARARVGVLEGQLATAQAEVVIRDGAIVGRDKAIDSLEAWRRNWNPLVDAHIKRCSGCDACDSEDGDDA